MKILKQIKVIIKQAKKQYPNINTNRWMALPQNRKNNKVIQKCSMRKFDKN